MYCFEACLIPNDAGLLVGVGIAVAGCAAGFAAVEAVELGADLVLGPFANGMAGKAFLERLLAGGYVLRKR